jgi:Mlc titration factor MtfA (ptsG expression regulator)
MSADAPLEEADANPLSRRNWGHALRAVGYLVFGSAFLFLLGAIVTMPEDVGFELRGTVVRGTVDRVERRPDDRLVTYSFVDHEGRSHTGTTRIVSGEPRRGDEIRVQYRTAEPSNHRAARDSKLRQQLGTDIQMILFVGLLTLALLSAVFLVNRRDSLLRVAAWLGRVLPGGRHRIWRRHPKTSEDDESPTFPFAWELALRKNMGLYARLIPAEQKLLQDLMLDFVPAREWVGTDGLEITDELEATVAGQACLLLLGIRDHDLFASVASIILHPGTFHRPTHTPMDAGGTALEGGVAVLGEAWYRGPVLLSWDEVLAGGRDPESGSNVVYHEFAHQLDFQGLDAGDSLTDEARADRRRWVEVMGREFAALVEAAEHGRATLLDHYGATDPREFFAVSTECFFERPVEMEATYSALYDVLRSFYGQDPASRLRRYREGVEMLRHKEHA